MKRGNIVVVGAGVGGLSAAIWLAARGHRVVLCEKEAAVGGKMRTMPVAGAAIDCGPTVLTMRPVFAELFAAAGFDLDQAVPLKKASVLARHAWNDTAHLDLYADRQRSADAIGSFAGAAAARGYMAFCEHARGVYETMDPLFIRADRPSPMGMMRTGGIRGLKGLVASAPFSTLWDCLGKYFPDPRLRQLFGRYATYCGSSPFAAPATLALIAHVEQEGVWLVEGGMAAFAAALKRVAEAAGVEIRTGVEITTIDTTGNRVTGVTLASGERMAATAVIANGDVGALASGCFGAAAKAAVATDAMLPRSLSAATWGFTARAKGFPLAHHSVFFSRSSQDEFADLFERNRPPADPTVYVCAQDRTDDGRLGASIERLFIIVNAPADAGRSLSRAEEIETCRNAMMATLARCGLTLRIEAAQHAGPATFSARYPGTDGAIYGMASHGWTASFRRPGARSKLEGLYLTGGSVHPGAGVPMAALSGRAAALALMADLGST